MAREILRQLALQNIVRIEVLPGPDVQSGSELMVNANAHAKTDHHPVGTCRMGPEGKTMSVVTFELKLRGMMGLMIADASMPVLVSGITNAPTIVTAEKASDHIRNSEMDTHKISVP